MSQVIQTGSPLLPGCLGYYSLLLDFSKQTQIKEKLGIKQPFNKYL